MRHPLLKSVLLSLIAALAGYLGKATDRTDLP
jgi:hypothetical protein